MTQPTLVYGNHAYIDGTLNSKHSLTQPTLVYGKLAFIDGTLNSKHSLTRPTLVYGKLAYIDGSLNIARHEILKNSDQLNYFDAKPLKPDKFPGIENNEIVSCYRLQ